MHVHSEFTSAHVGGNKSFEREKKRRLFIANISDALSKPLLWHNAVAMLWIHFQYPPGHYGNTEPK